MFSATPPEPTLPTLRELNLRQLMWTNNLLSKIPDLPAPALHKASIDHEDDILGLLTAYFLAVLAYVGSKVDRSTLRAL